MADEILNSARNVAFQKKWRVALDETSDPSPAPLAHGPQRERTYLVGFRKNTHVISQIYSSFLDYFWADEICNCARNVVCKSSKSDSSEPKSTPLVHSPQSERVFLGGFVNVVSNV
jgi:hypothetical protein